jgi:hypothetical protein
MDVGQPKDFVIGSTLYLDHISKTKPELLCKNQSCLGKMSTTVLPLTYEEVYFTGNHLDS